MIKVIASLFFAVSTIAISIFGLLPIKSADALSINMAPQVAEINDTFLPKQEEIQFQTDIEAVQKTYAYGNPAGCGESAPNISSAEMLAKVQGQLPELDLASLRMVSI
jgi:hypothetical protein